MVLIFLFLVLSEVILLASFVLLIAKPFVLSIFCFPLLAFSLYYYSCGHMHICEANQIMTIPYFHSFMPLGYRQVVMTKELVHVTVQLHRCKALKERPRKNFHNCSHLTQIREVL